MDNFVFCQNGADPEVTILDWQIVFRTQATYDLGYFLYQSLDVAVRRAHEKELIAAYMAKRQALGHGRVNIENVDAELPYVGFYCIIYPIIAGGLIDMTKPRSYPLIKAMSERAFASIEDYGSLELIRALL